MPTHPFCSYEVPVKTCRKCAFSALCLVGIDLELFVWRQWGRVGENTCDQMTERMKSRMRCVHEKTMGDTKPRRRR